MEVRSNRIGDLRSHYRRRLEKVYPEREADTLLFEVLMHYTGMSKANILVNHENTVSESVLLKIHIAVKGLLLEKPVQYILGRTEFYGLPFDVDINVLIPRPESEELVEMGLRHALQHNFIRVLDIGTGSGCIAIAMKHNKPELQVTAIDFSEPALVLAKKNASRNHTDVKFSKVDILDPSSRNRLSEYDLILSNPPYVRNTEKVQMKKNVLAYEPQSALFVPDDDPLIFYRNILEFGNTHLAKNGMILLEINQYLAKETKDLFLNNNYSNVQLIKDFRNNFRFLSVQ